MLVAGGFAAGSLVLPPRKMRLNTAARTVREDTNGGLRGAGAKRAIKGDVVSIEVAVCSSLPEGVTPYVRNEDRHLPASLNTSRNGGGGEQSKVI